MNDEALVQKDCVVNQIPSERNVSFISEELLPVFDAEIENAVEKLYLLGVKNGLAGLVLYYLARYQFTANEKFKELAIEKLFACIDRLNSGYQRAFVTRELSEIGHMILSAQQSGLIEVDVDDLLNDFDGVLYHKLQDDIQAKNFDATSGSLALALYFYRRNNEISRRAISEIVNQITALAQPGLNGVFWESQLKNDGAVYLGLSHGSASLINFLIILEKYHLSSGHRSLIDSASRFIINSKLQRLPVFYPVVVGEDNAVKTRWANNLCYGDPGTLYGLYQATEYLQDPELKSECLAQLKTAATRELSEPFLPTGYSVLYGYAGLALLYRKLYEQCREDFLSEAYESMTKRIVQKFDKNAPYLGYQGYWNQNFAFTNYSFAEGLIGIGLVLMGYVKPEINKHYETFYLF
jgi:lantibiotic biosynthesis protein